jgi:hypothetical protein
VHRFSTSIAISNGGWCDHEFPDHPQVRHLQHDYGPPLMSIIIMKLGNNEETVKTTCEILVSLSPGFQRAQRLQPRHEMVMSTASHETKKRNATVFLMNSIETGRVPINTQVMEAKVNSQPHYKYKYMNGRCVMSLVDLGAKEWVKGRVLGAVDAILDANDMGTTRSLHFSYSTVIASSGINTMGYSNPEVVELKSLVYCAMTPKKCIMPMPQYNGVPVYQQSCRTSAGYTS